MVDVDPVTAASHSLVVGCWAGQLLEAVGLWDDDNTCRQSAWALEQLGVTFMDFEPRISNIKMSQACMRPQAKQTFAASVAFSPVPPAAR